MKESTKDNGVYVCFIANGLHKPLALGLIQIKAFAAGRIDPHLRIAAFFGFLATHSADCSMSDYSGSRTKYGISGIKKAPKLRLFLRLAVPGVRLWDRVGLGILRNLATTLHSELAIQHLSEFDMPFHNQPLLCNRHRFQFYKSYPL